MVRFLAPISSTLPWVVTAARPQDPGRREERRRLRRLRLVPAAAALFLAATSAAAVDFDDTRLLSDPAISGDRIAFQYGGDLWLGNIDGSGVRRLTSHEGVERNPRFSPDGSLLAFTGQYDGNSDVFVMPVEGGLPRRLTWHPEADLVQGFTPDGAEIFFASQRNISNSRHLQLFEIPVQPSAGRFPRQLPIPNGYRAAYSPDGRSIAYIPTPGAFHQWKNYRGGQTSRIWVYDVQDHGVVQIPQPDGRCNDTDPMWIGDRVYFRSDRAGEFNLFSWPRGGALEDIAQHTSFGEFPVLALQGDGERLIFEQGGYLHTFSPPEDRSTRLQIGVIDDLDDLRPRWVDGAEWISSGDVSPSGERAVFAYRGDILTLPAKKGDLRPLTQTPGVHERSPVWSPDGRRIAYFSDAGGEYRLHVRAQDGSGEARVIDLAAAGGAGFYEEPKWSPDSQKISLVDNSWGLFIVDLAAPSADPRVLLVAREPSYGPRELRALEHDWSPDARWLAYTKNSRAAVASAYLYDTRDGTHHQITDGLSDVAHPVFDRSGLYLYFLASTDAGPVKQWFAMSNADMQRTASIYAVVLRADEPSPLAPESDEVALEDPAAREAEASNAANGTEKQGAEPAKGREETTATRSALAAGGADDVEPTRIDLQDIDQRIVALPLASANYSELAAGERKVFALARSDSPGGPDAGDLVLFDLEERKETKLASDIDGFTLTADGSKLFYVAGERWGIAAAGTPIDFAESALAISKLRTRVDPTAEWPQIFREVWRINRDYFYDPNMHGADWDAVGEKYTQFLSHLSTRSDLNRVLEWMLSELAVGHSYLGGGDERSEPERVPGGLLGADWEVVDGRYRIARLFSGLNWTPELRAPLTEPGVNARQGEYLLAVNGRDLTASDNLYEPFEGTAERIIEITLGPSADGSGSRTVRVVPLRSERALRNRAWVEGNLERVNEATDGRVAYVYVPNTTNLGHQYFKRYFYPQVDKQAIIIDERFNAGGQVADYAIDHLRRPHIAYWATRYGADLRTPSASIQGPKVMIADETAGSGGDLLPWMFRNLGLGTIIGKQTWGGLVGVLGFPSLIDGGFVTAPNLAIWTEDGFVVENEGVPPDIEVEQYPAELIAGRDPQLEKAIEVVLQQLEANPPSEVTRPPFPTRAVRAPDR